MSILETLTLAAAMDRGIQETSDAQVPTLLQEIKGADMTIEHLQESLADMELMLEDRGWERIGLWANQQFTRQGLVRSAILCRAMAVANPLIRRGLNLRIAYVWGGGVEISAKAQGGNDGEQDVNAVVQAFLADKAVRKVLVSGSARERNERVLGTDGNVIVALFTSPLKGTVQPRLLPFTEVEEIISNPDDRAEPWFYKRVHIGSDGDMTTTYHPDVDYQPRLKLRVVQSDTTLGTATMTPGEVAWDAPVIHVKVNDLQDWSFGVGDAFAAIAWARAYKEFLEDWAKLVKALSRFAWRLTSERKGAAQSAAAAIRKTPPTDSARPVWAGDPSNDARPVGQTFSQTGGQLEAIPKSGATIDSQSGKPLAAMVASAMDVPVTMLLGDPGISGARATAETLDTPTELMANMRRDLWTEFYRRLFDYVIDASVKAPQGALKGVISKDEWGRTVTVLDGDTTRSIEISWPELGDTPISTLIHAIAQADATEKLPPLVIAKMLLQAFQVTDADEIIEDLVDENGDWKDPNPLPPAPLDPNNYNKTELIR